jgi:hypothetical protein
MFLTLGTFHSRTGTAVWEYALLYLGRRLPVSEVLPRLEKPPRETERVSPNNCAETNQ